MAKKKQTKRAPSRAGRKVSAAQRALDNLEKGNTQAALSWAQSISADRFAQEDAWVAGMVFMRADHPEKALQIFTQLHQAEPDRQDVSFALACCNAGLGHVKEALSVFANGLPDADGNTCLQFAYSLEKGGERSEAADLLASAYARFPTEPELALALAQMRIDLGDRDAGESVLRESLSQGIHQRRLEARAWFNLGVSLEARGLPSNATSEYETVYRNAINADQSYSNAWINLSVYLIGVSRFEDAIELLQQARLQFPELQKTTYLLAYAYHLNGNTLQAVEQLEELVNTTDDHVQGWELLGRCLVDLGKTDAAVRHFRRWLSVAPGQPTAVHMLAALDGQSPPSRASAAYVSDTFDTFADTFDSMLSKLEYRGPELFRQLLSDNLVDVQSHSLAVLDAGCGTGLMGSVLQEYAKTLDGVDLSQEMLSRAKETNLYGRLVCMDLIDYLRESSSRYDLIVAADTFNYFGDLSTLLPLCFAALRTDGWLVFSLEQGPLSDDSYALQPNGRYIHSPHYLVWQMGEVGITGGTMRKVVLRKENDKDVLGLLFAVQRPASTTR